MGTAAKPTRANRTITVDFRNEATYFRLLEDGKAFLEFVFAFILSMGFQLTHKTTCGGGGCLTRHSHYVRVRLEKYWAEDAQLYEHEFDEISDEEE
jgi:hypothetical protein